MRSAPPRILEGLLAAFLPDDLSGESILGDARESWVRWSARRSPWGAVVAYAGLVLRLVFTYALPRRLGALGAGVADMFRESGRALRRLLRSPASALSAATVLALGTGLVVLVFALLQGVFLGGMGYPDEDRLVGIRAVAPSIGLDASLFSPEQAQALAGSLQGVTEGVATYHDGSTVVEGDEGAWRLQAAWLSGNAMPLLGVPPVLGRTLLPEDDVPTGDAAVVLSYRSWIRDFGGDADVLGRTVRVEGRAGRIVGVMPDGFAFPQMTEVWMTQARSPGLRTVEGRRLDDVEIFARRAAGVGEGGFEAALTAAGAALRATLDDPAPDLVPTSRPLSRAVIGEELPGFLALVMAAAGLVLVVACANVANLLLARAWSRQGEVGVRRALGGSRARVVIPFLAEAGVLAVLGTLLGLGGAAVGVRWLDRVIQPRPLHMEFAIDGGVMVFALGVAAGTALLAGILPALRASGVEIVEVLKGAAGGRGTQGRSGRAGRTLVVIEVALSCAVLVGGAVTGRALFTTLSTDPGFDPEGVQVARVLVDGGTADPIPASASLVRFLDRLAVDGDYATVAAATTLPAVDGVDPELEIDEAEATGPDGSAPRGSVVSVSPGYFELLGAVALAGRTLQETDGPGSPAVAVVNEALAARLWGETSPLGRRVRVRGSETWHTVVGVVPELSPQGLGAEAESGGLYLPLLRTPPEEFWVMARTRWNATELPRGGAAAVASGSPLAATVRASLRTVGLRGPVWNEGTLSDEIRAAHWPLFVFGSLFLAFGAAALFTAGVGLYGVLAYQVRDRTRELGIRAALGAGGTRIVRETLQRLLLQVGVGALVGLALGWLAATGLEMVAPGVDPRDPLLYLGVGALVAGVATVAAWFPARRATRVDPAMALRGD